MKEARRIYKETLILNAAESLLKAGKGAAFTVSEVAEVAGIGKGSVYNYFNSKEDIIMALIIRTYKGFIDNCRAVLQAKANALGKMKLLFEVYYTQASDTAIETYTHLFPKAEKKTEDPAMLAAYMRLPENADMHLKTLNYIVTEIAPIMTEIIREGDSEGTFVCKTPKEHSQIILTVFAFLFDSYIFGNVKQDFLMKLKAFADVMEKCLSSKKGGFSFIYKSNLSAAK
jgi:AcrR family transcriptional regulator